MGGNVKVTAVIDKRTLASFPHTYYPTAEKAQNILMVSGNKIV